MFSVDSSHPSPDAVSRTLEFLSHCPAFPLPATPVEKLAGDACRSVNGPGWYDSSWDLSCGLDIAEVPDLDGWISVSQNEAALSVRA